MIRTLLTFDVELPVAAPMDVGGAVGGDDAGEGWSAVVAAVVPVELVVVQAVRSRSAASVTTADRARSHW
jgi:hypothetical protein